MSIRKRERRNETNVMGAIRSCESGYQYITWETYKCEGSEEERAEGKIVEMEKEDKPSKQHSPSAPQGGVNCACL